MKRVGTSIEPFTNDKVTEISMLAAVAQADAKVEQAGDSVHEKVNWLLQGMLDMAAEVEGDAKAAQLLRDVAPIALSAATAWTLKSQFGCVASGCDVPTAMAVAKAKAMVLGMATAMKVAMTAAATMAMASALQMTMKMAIARRRINLSTSELEAICMITCDVFVLLVCFVARDLRGLRVAAGAAVAGKLRTQKPRAAPRPAPAAP